MNTDRFIVNYLVEHRGRDAALTYARQTLQVYRKAVLNRQHFASTAQYRRAFIMSYLFYKHYLSKTDQPAVNPRSGEKQPVKRVTRTARREKARDYETMIDEELAGTFPASDPPSWTLGGSILGAHVHH